MNRASLIALIGLVVGGSACADESLVIDSLENLPAVVPDKSDVQLVDGKFGRAVKMGFPQDCQNVFVQLRASGTPDWNKAAGFSFWVKGDGSNHLGGIEMIWDGNYALRYAVAFPIDNTEWQKVIVRWRDLVPETATPAALPIDPTHGNAPSKLGTIWFGKWWYWRDYAAHSYSIDQIELEPTIDDGRSNWRPKGDPLARVKAKLQRKEPAKIVLMGDSLTDVRHWANREQNWPALLAEKLAQAAGIRPTIVNTAIGGTELRQNLVLVPRWSHDHHDADLVIVCFGGNDWASGMRGGPFQQTNRDAIERIRRGTGGGADVLLCTTCPSVERWQTMSELSEACRAAAKSENAGLADIEAAFHVAGKTPADRERLFASDKTHLGPAGHELFAATVLEQLQ